MLIMCYIYTKNLEKLGGPAKLKAFT